MSAIQRAVKIIGGQSETARRIGLHNKRGSLAPQAVSAWCAKNRVPAEYVIAIEFETEGKVSRHELRPDLYPMNNAPKKRKPNKSAAFQHV